MILRKRPHCSRLFLSLILTAVTAQAAPSIKVARHAPYNLFEPTENVTLTIRHRELPAGTVSGDGELRNYNGNLVWSQKVPFQEGTPTTVDFGRLPRGYYQFKVVVAEKYEGKASLGVTEFANRSAKEAREGGYVFGVKWWGGVNAPKEGADALSKLGLQWTRVIQNQGGAMSTKEMLTAYPINAVIKIERFPKELYDAEKYGRLDEWEKKYGRGSWTLKSLPKKEPYQAYLRQQLAENVPPDQQVFEIWNEPWDKMSPEDFATLSQWIAEVVLKDRPNAILGPNLGGSTSPYEYDARVIKAGGLKGMKMVALHPYGNATDRAWMREYRQWLNKETGTAMDIYITEYGSHSTPKGPNARSEREQARRIVMQSLALYAEGAKALIPHWLGQSESNPTYLEDWFGFVRQNEQPKPALLAHANTARLIDGSQYLGDLWFGPRVGAMLFQKNGTTTLALWTGNDSSGSGSVPTSKEIELQPGVKQVTVVEIDGQEHQETVTDGKLTLKLTESPIYVVGVSPDLARQASKELRADLWPKPEKPAKVKRVAHKFKTPPVLDGNFDDWKGMMEIGLTNPKVAGADASGSGYIGWDDEFLYIGVDMRDNEMLNIKPRSKLYLQDSVELFLSTNPREIGSGFGPQDYQFFITPTSEEGKPILGRVTDREAGVVSDVTGGRIFAGLTQKSDRGWAVEAAIPWAEIAPFKPQNGAKAALEMRVSDADTSHERFKIDPSDLPDVLSVTNPSSWSLLDFQD
jgi:hypothetical protein